MKDPFTVRIGAVLQTWVLCNFVESSHFLKFQFLFITEACEKVSILAKSLVAAILWTDKFFEFSQLLLHVGGKTIFTKLMAAIIKNLLQAVGSEYNRSI